MVETKVIITKDIKLFSRENSTQNFSQHTINEHPEYGHVLMTKEDSGLINFLGPAELRKIARELVKLNKK